MSKKVMALMVSAIMLTGTLVGCGSDTSSNSSSASPASTTSSSSSASTTSTTSSSTTNSTASTSSSSTDKTQTPAPTANNADTPQVIQVPVTIVNNTDVDFYELYTSGAGVDNWGDSIIPQGQVLSPGTQLSQIAFNIDANNLKWDLMAKDENGDALEFYDLDLSNCSTDGITISLTYDRDTQTGTITAQ
ncbi:MAG: hypothetical protein Q4F66_04885 [Clostridium sp.]|nr:hypothetical protein [Clostridium sp.]